MSSETSPPELRRNLSLWETTLGGVGMILGAGIYALIGAATAEAGSGVWLSFLVAAIFAAIVGLCYAELSSMFPRAAADYEYAHQALGERPAFLVGWLMAIGNILAAAAVSVAFASYFGEFLQVDSTIVSLCALLLAAAVASIGIKESLRVAVIATIVEMAGLIFIIAIGIPDLPEVELTRFESGLFGVAAGTSLVMFAFNGFAQIATLAEEAVDAPRVVPRAMLLAIGITTVLYIGVALAALAVLGPDDLVSSERPLTDMAARVLGSGTGRVIAVIALFSTANTMLLHLIVGSRMVYGMASERALPAPLAWVHPRLQTPLPAIAVSLVVAVAFSLSGEISFVASATNFTIFVGIASVCVSLIVLRRARPLEQRPFRVPLTVKGLPLIPVVGLITTAVLTSTLETDALLVGVGLLVVGLMAMAARRTRGRREPPAPDDSDSPVR